MTMTTSKQQVVATAAVAFAVFMATQPSMVSAQGPANCNSEIVETTECPVEAPDVPRWPLPLIQQVLYSNSDKMNSNVRNIAYANSLDPYIGDFLPEPFPTFKLADGITSVGVDYDVYVENLTLPMQTGYSSALSNTFTANYLCGNLSNLPAEIYFESYVTTTLSSPATNYYEATLRADPVPPAGDPLRSIYYARGSVDDSGPAVTHFFVRGNATISSNQACITHFEEIKGYVGSAKKTSVTGASPLLDGYQPLSTEFQMSITQIARMEGPRNVKQMWDNALYQLGPICATY